MATTAFVRQREEMDCGVAVAAMACGLGYDAVRGIAEVEGLYDGGPITVERLRRLLEGCAGLPWESRVTRPYRPFRDWIAEGGFPDGCPILIREPGVGPYGGGCHWIATRAGRVFDPYLARPMTPRRYGYARWDVLRVLTPRAAG